MNTSVIIITYRRINSLNLILSNWLKQTNDVWLCDCTPNGFNTNLPINIIRATPDPGNKLRHAIATITQGDLIIKADDDTLPLPNLINDFISFHHQLPNSILGIHGRIFLNIPDYYQTPIIKGKSISQPTQVDFTGIITCTPRQFLPMDLKNCHTPIEDLYWQILYYKNITKYVIPTKNYEQLPESKDKYRLCANKEARKIREEFYKKYIYNTP